MSDFLIAAVLIGGVFIGIVSEVISTEPEEWEEQRHAHGDG